MNFYNTSTVSQKYPSAGNNSHEILIARNIVETIFIPGILFIPMGNVEWSENGGQPNFIYSIRPFVRGQQFAALYDVRGVEARSSKEGTGLAKTR